MYRASSAINFELPNKSREQRPWKKKKKRKEEKKTVSVIKLLAATEEHVGNMGTFGVRRVQRFQRRRRGLRVEFRPRCRGGFVRAITGKTVINHGRSGESEATDKAMEGRGT